ncbi:MAG TPA: hypothetical protein VN698_08755 [Bacteroidia bacterium]|nr:hypothetical protein [Bacteroidia bacterium]
MDIFNSKKTKGIKSHIANLVAIAQSDGNFSVAEKRLIFEIGQRNGLAISKIKDIIKSTEPIEFKVPKNDSARFDRVYDLVEMVLADGERAEEEMDACIEMAEKLGFRKAITGVLVTKIEKGILQGISREQIKAESADFLTYEE